AQVDGGAGSDTVRVERGASRVDIVSSQDAVQDILLFGAGLLPEDLRLARDSDTGNSLIVGMPGGGTVRVNELFAAGPQRSSIATICFLDAPAVAWTLWAVQRLLCQGDHRNSVLKGFDGTADVMLGLGGDDQIEAGAGHDTLVGGTGNDHLVGGNGDDEYGYARGDDNDTVFDTAGTDLLRL